MSDVLELCASPENSKWTAHEEDIESSLIDLAVLHLEREKQLGAARSDLGGMLRAAGSFLKIREQLLADSMAKEHRDKLLALAEISLEENCLKMPPLSALIGSLASPKNASAKCHRTARAFTILLLHAAPQGFETNTTLLSDKVNMILFMT